MSESVIKGERRGACRREIQMQIKNVMDCSSSRAINSMPVCTVSELPSFDISL